jgi:hypothetical protein
VRSNSGTDRAGLWPTGTLPFRLRPLVCALREATSPADPTAVTYRSPRMFRPGVSTNAGWRAALPDRAIECFRRSLQCGRKRVQAVTRFTDSRYFQAGLGR